MRSISKTFTSFLITSAILVVTQFCCTNSTPVPTTASTELFDPLDTLEYSPHPNEVLPIQPVLLYPKARKLLYQGRNLDQDDDIIYVKLLKRKSYRPKSLPNIDEDEINPPRELTMKDIFYVKALANGQFSHQRVKWYRLPEFYAISVYRKGTQRQ